MSQAHRAEVATPGLDRYLATPAPRERRLLGPELRACLQEAYASSAPQPIAVPALADVDAPACVMAMWRLTRAMARILGMCAEDETLDSATAIHPSPWTTPTYPRPSPALEGVVRRARAAGLVRAFQEGAGLTLLPPAPEDPSVLRWCRMADDLAYTLGILTSPIGRAGALPLLDEERAPYCGITEEQVLAFEELLIDEAGRELIEVGERSTVAHFREKYGLSRSEALGLVRLARVEAARAGSSSVEEDRAIMVAQLKDYVGRARETMNMADELRGLKELSRVQGLTRSEPEDMAKDFLRVVGAVASRQDRVLELPPPSKHPKLPASNDDTEVDEDTLAFDLEQARLRVDNADTQEEVTELQNARRVRAEEKR